MTTNEIRKKLHVFIDTAQDKKVKAMYTLMESELEQGNYWDDEKFVAEMHERVNDLETGKVKGYTLEEAKERIKKVIKASKKR